MVYLFFRQNEIQTSLPEQKRTTLAYAHAQSLDIHKEVVEYSNTKQTIEEREQFEQFLQSLTENDVLIVHSLSTLSHFVEEGVKLINCLLSRSITLHIATSHTMLTPLTKVGEIFPLLNDLHEIVKVSDKKIGRPKGSLSPSKFDKYQAQIVSLLRKGLSVSAIARELSVSRSSLKDYITSRNIKMLAEDSWIEVSSMQDTHQKAGTILLICPFEEQLI
jgi:DNA invertase Pin-like site-specific DNA recombinase